MRKGCTRLALCVALSVFWQPAPAANDDWRQKIDREVLARAQTGEAVEFIVVLEARADFPAWRAEWRKEEKGLYVFEQTSRAAQLAQLKPRAILERAGADFRAFHIVNAIWARGDLALLEQLARLTEVARIDPNPRVRLDMPWQEAQGVRQRDELEWGLARIRADEVWKLGYNGEGAVVAGADTGYEWQHPTINRQYRGATNGRVDHNYNWHDAIREISPLHRDSIVTPDLNPCGLQAQSPCDDNGHGTHTMGTMIGDDGAGNRIGVAPAAKWIACRNMERGYGTPATYIECFEWFLAPTDLSGANPDPRLAPHVINNSWGCPEMEGCNPGNWALMEAVVNTLKAAGIVVVASAGNSGPRCETVRIPAAIFEAAFSIGAIGFNDTIARFSSRGPVAVDGSGRLKPDVVAPGVGVRSAVRNGGFARFSGTSMAGPHVAGIVALMISANPDLAGQVERIEAIIEETARPRLAEESCGNLPSVAIPNHTYGYGIVDALAAAEAALALSGHSPPAGVARVRVAPNPFQDQLFFTLEGVGARVTFELFNAAGQLLRREGGLTSPPEETTFEWFFGELPVGVYFYRFSGTRGAVAGKVIKR